MSWTIRSSPPSAANRYYIKTTYGGLNYCILINGSTGECIPNCVGYAWGRFIEGTGQTYSNLSRGNASVWYGATSDGYARGQNPRVGAVMCWDGGSYGGAGHVCIVEQVIDSNTVITSESNYGGTRWYSKTRYRGDGNWGLGGSYHFQGFIYNPWVDNVTPPSPIDPDDPQPTPSGFPEILTYLLPVMIFKKRKKGGIR